MIALTDITKRFGRRVAVQALTLTVPRGVVFGLLGHNGAGKSTVIGLLLGQILPDAGTARINGADVLSDRARALARVGAIYETPAFYDYLSGARNLRLFCEYTTPFNDQRFREVVQFVGLESRIHDRVGAYSHGMRQRLALAQALLPSPELLILDEPTDGLDPEGIHETRQLIRRLHKEWGLTLFISSHLLSEMEQLCSHLAVLRDGQLLFEGDWRHRAAERQRVEIVVGERSAEALAGLRAAGLVTALAAPTVAQLAPGADVPAVAAWLVQHGYRVERLGPVEDTLEDFYLQLLRPPAVTS